MSPLKNFEKDIVQKVLGITPVPQDLVRSPQHSRCVAIVEVGERVLAPVSDLRNELCVLALVRYVEKGSATLQMGSPLNGIRSFCCNPSFCTFPSQYDQSQRLRVRLQVCRQAHL